MDSAGKSPIDALTEFNRQLLQSVVKPLVRDGAPPATPEILQSLTAGVVSDAQHWLDIQNRYYQKQLELWGTFASRGADKPPAKIVEPEPGDRRFRGSEWQQPYFSFIAQAYLLNARWLNELVESAQLEAHAKKKLRFFARQYIDALSPSNFAWSNPEALKIAAESGGDSVARGLTNLAGDIDRGLVSMSDEKAFEVGGNLAVTPGAVVYENEYMQLLQYRPSTETVHARPLLMVPPFINKYYILDLQPENSFVRYAVGEGHTVFMVSWRNMPEAMGKASWDDYLSHGVLRALEVAREITRADQVNALGFCVGGTLLGSAVAVKRAQGDERVASVTLLTTMLDFSDTGELSVFIDEPYVRKREVDFANGGVVPGRELALTFASLRANDLIWQYVVNNYLKGRTPQAFDLLYWNSDSTDLPGAMYTYYIRNMYLHNRLREPGKLIMCGVPVDLRRIDVPAFVLASREDHIVPWKTAYESARLLRGDTTFVLAASGHIAGVVNPAARNRRNYWRGGKLTRDAERWLQAAQAVPGSWWTHWSRWLEAFGGGRIPARNVLGNETFTEIEPAPGRYVKDKAR